MNTKRPRKEAGVPGEGQEKNEILFDAQLLSGFIYELNISRRLVSSYPHGHPFIRVPLQKAVDLLARLLQFREEITLGVARDCLIFEQRPLERKNPVYRDYARGLFQAGIVALVFARDLQADELFRFHRLLRKKRKEIGERGGIERIVQEEGLCHIRVRGVEYRLFRVVEEEQIGIPPAPREDAGASIWEAFVQGLLAGTLNPSRESPAEKEIAPHLLAQVLNCRESGGPRGRDLDYEHVMAAYLRGALGEEGEKRKADLEKLSAFMSRLNPGLRRQFLSGIFRSLASQDEWAEEVLGPLPGEIIWNALEDLNARNLTASPFILNLLHKLGGYCSPEGGGFPAGNRESPRRLAASFTTIFREDHLAELVPPVYRETLQGLMGIEKISGLELPEREELETSLEEAEIEMKTCLVMLKIMKSGPVRDTEGALERNLKETINGWVEAGNFRAVNEFFDRAGEGESEAEKRPPQRLCTLATPEFARGVAHALNGWGKEKYAEVRKLVGKIGEPFIEPLLDLLGGTSSLSLRRFCVDCLVEMGAAARGPVLRRLGDPRWYVVRNLLVILRLLEDPGGVPALRNLVRHGHPKVREEALRALRHFASLGLIDEGEEAKG